MNAIKPQYRPIVMLCLLALFLLAVGVACGGNPCGDTVPWSDPQCQPHPENIVLDRTQIEQGVVDYLQQQCAQSTECKNSQLP